MTASNDGSGVIPTPENGRIRFISKDGTWSIGPIWEPAEDQFDVLAKEINETSVEKGFWGPLTPMDQYAAKLALIHSEVTEVLEALRKSQGIDKVTEEFADILIRTFDLYNVLVEVGEASPELYWVMWNKMQTNKERPKKHGNRWG